MDREKLKEMANDAKLTEKQRQGIQKKLKYINKPVKK